MITTPCQRLISNQSLILSYIKDKLDIINFIMWGYNNNLPVLINNGFLHSATHVYYRSIIVEVCTLFDNHKFQSNNFHLLINEDKKYSKELTSNAIEFIKEKLLDSKNYFLEEIINIRNEEVSHFRFKDGTKISLNHEYLDELNNLFDLAKQIIKISQYGFKDTTKCSDHMIGLSGHSLDSLQRLLKKASGFDYKSVWKIDNE